MIEILRERLESSSSPVNSRTAESKPLLKMRLTCHHTPLETRGWIVFEYLVHHIRVIIIYAPLLFKNI